MPTFSNIAGAEPSTVTFRLASVTKDRGGVIEHQELVTLGGAESSLAVAAVRDATPASTEWALAVREVAHSTIMSVSTGSVRVHQSTAADLNVTVAGYVAPSTIVTVSTGSVRVHQSTAADLNVTVAGYVAPSTVVTVSTGSVRVHQSTAADLNVTVAGYVAPSTTVSVSTVQGVVRIAGNNAADGIVHVGDSTNAALRVNVVAGSAASTTVNVSSLAGRVAVAGFHATDGIVNVTDSTNTALRVNVVAGAAGGSTQVTVSQLLDSSGGSVAAADSANNAIRVNVVAGAAGGSTIVTVSTGSVRVHQSSAADLNVTVAGYSTIVAISSLAGAVIVRSSAANALITAYQSSAVDLQVTASQNSTAWSVLARTTTSSGGGIEGSTGTPAAGVLGLHTRQVYPTMNSTTLVITSTHSTAIYALISSVAGLRHKVYAYFIGSTHTAPSTLIFCSSASASAFDHWHVNFGSGSSGITGANLALNPPGFIFAGVSQNALNVRIEGGSSVTSTVVARISLAWFDEA